jgi:hypothetical protein
MAYSILPAGDATILDTWHTAGLRGTASHDFVLRDCFIPAHRTCWFTHAPAWPEPLYRLPAVAVFTAWIAAVPLGIAHHAIDVFTALTGAKTPTWSHTQPRGSTRQGPRADREQGEQRPLLSCSAAPGGSWLARRGPEVSACPRTPACLSRFKAEW